MVHCPTGCLNFDKVKNPVVFSEKLHDILISMYIFIHSLFHEFIHKFCVTYYYLLKVSKSQEFFLEELKTSKNLLRFIDLSQYAKAGSE